MALSKASTVLKQERLNSLNLRLSFCIGYMSNWNASEICDDACMSWEFSVSSPVDNSVSWICLWFIVNLLFYMMLPFCGSSYFGSIKCNSQCNSTRERGVVILNITLDLPSRFFVSTISIMIFSILQISSSAFSFTGHY